MSVQVQTIYNRVRSQLIDTGTPPRWSNQELINWICDGERAIVAVIPRASQKVAVISMVVGTRQTIPSDGYMLLTVYRNMNASGHVPGVVPLKQSRILLDTQYPGWHQASQVRSPSTYTFDPSDPTAFYVYPPSDGVGTLEISYSVSPADLVNPTDVIQVQDIYATALFDYCMYRACQKDSDFAAGAAAAAAYYSSFSSLLSNLLKDADSIATMKGDN